MTLSLFYNGYYYYRGNTTYELSSYSVYKVTHRTSIGPNIQHMSVALIEHIKRNGNLSVTGKP